MTAEPETAPVPIERIAAGGDGVGRMEDGRAIFVARTAPGDVVVPAVVRLHRRHARARIGRLVAPGPGRAEPPCPHYVGDDCGGCQLQHLAYSAQLAAKAAIVGDSLRRIGGLEASDPAVAAAEQLLEYRTKITLAVAERGNRIGLHPVDRPERVFDLRWCHITHPELNRLWEAASRLRRLLPPNARHLVLRLDRRGGRHLIVRTGSAEVRRRTAGRRVAKRTGGRRTDERPWTGGGELARGLDRAGVSAVVWWHPEGGAPRAVAGAGEAYPATVFEQVNPAMGDRARDAAVRAAGVVAGAHVWDLYAGIGETTARIAAAGATVDSVESDRRAVDWAESQGPGRPRVVRHAGKVEDLLAELRRPAIVITNPPRTGMHERATAALAAAPASRIVYVSCDPTTLARDLARLGPAWRLRTVEAFDLFPQTAHVESVALLERA